jgi:hypothetical protein
MPASDLCLPEKHAYKQSTFIRASYRRASQRCASLIGVYVVVIHLRHAFRIFNLGLSDSAQLAIAHRRVNSVRPHHFLRAGLVTLGQKAYQLIPNTNFTFFPFRIQVVLSIQVNDGVCLFPYVKIDVADLNSEPCMQV